MRYLPTGAHALALTAAIGQPEAAGEAYRQWRADGHPPDVEERRLLTLIAANVAPLLPEDAFLAEVQRERRRTMAAHVRRIAGCKLLADALAVAGIDALFFKGVGMLPWYRDPTVRTMFDADLLVPWQLRHEAIDVLVASGYSPSYGRVLEEVHVLADSEPGAGMHHSNGTEVDLHWRPLHNVQHRPHIDAQLFSSARVATISTVGLLVPDPSHHLVLVLAHGMRFSSQAQLISLADAAHLLRTNDFDPDRAAQLAREYERASAVVEGCNILAEMNLQPDLAEPIARLRRRLRRPTIADRLLARVAAVPFGESARSQQLASDTWTATITTPLRKGGPLGGWLRVVSRHMGVRRRRDIPGQLLWLAARRPLALERLRADRGTPLERRVRLAIGDEVRVGTLAWPARFLPTGWWDVDREHAWTHGREAVIDFQLDLGAAGAGTLALTMVPFTSHLNRGVTVNVRINGRPVAAWSYAHEQPFALTQRIPVDDTMLDHGRCEIMFLIRGASSPHAAGLSNDARELGMGLIALGVEAPKV